MHTPTTSLAPAGPPGPADALLQTVLQLSLTGIYFLRPRYSANGHDLHDFDFGPLNPAAQRMLLLPAQPTKTFLEQFPSAAHDGVFAFFHDTFLSGFADHYGVSYAFNGINAYFHLAAQRQGDQLVVSFTDTADGSRRALETNLRAGQDDLRQFNTALETRVVERTLALTEALVEAQRQREQVLVQEHRLQQIMAQVPAAVATVSGPDHRFTFSNVGFEKLFGERITPGTPLADVFPPAVGQGYVAVFDQVYATGQPAVGTEAPGLRRNAATGQDEPAHLNFVFQPLPEVPDQPRSTLIFVVDATERVLARQRDEATQRQIQLITDALPILISYIDRDQRFQFANQAYESWFGRPPAELIGQPVRAIVGETVYADIIPYLEQVLAGQAVEFESYLPERPASSHYLYTRYVPDVQQGQVVGCFSLVTNVTELVLARQQVQHLNNELAAANEELSDASQQQLQA